MCEWYNYLQELYNIGLVVLPYIYTIKKSAKGYFQKVEIMAFRVIKKSGWKKTLESLGL